MPVKSLAPGRELLGWEKFLVSWQISLKPNNLCGVDVAGVTEIGAAPY